MIKDSTTKLIHDVADDMTVKDLVQMRTGMTEEQLLDDQRDYHINNLTEAVQLFTDCAKAKNHIHIHTDYDGDGWGSAFILHMLCQSIGANHEVYLPDRETDGYGIKVNHVEKYLKPGDLLILADNGIAAHDAIQKAKDMGCKVLVLDHHEGFIGPSGDILLPNADVVVDPHVTGGDFIDYCGAGLCFKFAKQFYETKCTAIKDRWQPILNCMNVAASISTITDSVSLTDDNRKIVKDGFRLYREGYLTDGLKAVAKELWMPTVRQLTGDDIGFTLGPAVNALGRMLPFGAKLFYEISIANGAAATGPQFIAKVKKVKEVNEARKAYTKSYFKADCEQIETEGWQNDGVIALFHEGTMAGLDGIRAGKIAEAYGAVTFAFSRDANGDLTIDENGVAKPGPNAVLKGSGRTAGGVDVKHLLDRFSAIILPNYGGHQEACGLKIYENMLDLFRTEANRIISKDDIHIDNNLHYDMEIDWEDITPEFIAELNKMGPYGTGNPAPRFYIKNIPVAPGYTPKPKDGQDLSEPTYYMGTEKDSFCGATPNGVKVTGFNGIGTEFRDENEPAKISVVGTLCEDEKRGVVVPQIRIDAFTMDIERNMNKDKESKSVDEECL